MKPANCVCHGSTTTVTCTICDESVTLPVTQEHIDDWQDGMSIQRAMPHLHRRYRQLFISATCDDCFETMFGGE